MKCVATLAYSACVIGWCSGKGDKTPPLPTPFGRSLWKLSEVGRSSLSSESPQLYISFHISHQRSEFGGAFSLFSTRSGGRRRDVEDGGVHWQRPRKTSAPTLPIHSEGGEDGAGATLFRVRAWVPVICRLGDSWKVSDLSSVWYPLKLRASHLVH